MVHLVALSWRDGWHVALWCAVGHRVPCYARVTAAMMVPLHLALQATIGDPLALRSPVLFAVSIIKDTITWKMGSYHAGGRGGGVTPTNELEMRLTVLRTEGLPRMPHHWYIPQVQFQRVHVLVGSAPVRRARKRRPGAPLPHLSVTIPRRPWGGATPVRQHFSG